MFEQWVIERTLAAAERILVLGCDGTPELLEESDLACAALRPGAGDAPQAGRV